ncbi:hypothetical protein, partial [Dyella silvatica]|uniref:hypothetical protein n=1 Tax=Dyella silvatica TaxID=2992128 RepID=UPI002254D7C4
MPFFQIRYLGEGISMPFADGDPVKGFYATRIVHAGNPQQAHEKAKARVLQDWLTGDFAARNTGGVPDLSVDACREV